jgi:hypothetical protein
LLPFRPTSERLATSFHTTAMDATSSPAQLRADACFRVPVDGAGRSPLGTRPAGGKGTSLVCSPEQPALSYLLRSVRRLPTGSAPVRFQSGNSRDFTVKAEHWRHTLARQKRPICRDIPRCAESRALLAMQKVRFESHQPLSEKQYSF